MPSPRRPSLPLFGLSKIFHYQLTRMKADIGSIFMHLRKELVHPFFFPLPKSQFYLLYIKSFIVLDYYYFLSPKKEILLPFRCAL